MLYSQVPTIVHHNRHHILQSHFTGLLQVPDTAGPGEGRSPWTAAWPVQGPACCLCSTCYPPSGPHIQGMNNTVRFQSTSLEASTEGVRSRTCTSLMEYICPNIWAKCPCIQDMSRLQSTSLEASTRSPQKKVGNRTEHLTLMGFS